MGIIGAILKYFRYTDQQLRQQDTTNTRQTNIDYAAFWLTHLNEREKIRRDWEQKNRHSIEYHIEEAAKSLVKNNYGWVRREVRDALNILDDWLNLETQVDEAATQYHKYNRMVGDTVPTGDTVKEEAK